MNYTKKELIEKISRKMNHAEIFYEAAETALTKTELRKLNLIEAASEIATAFLYLTDLHKDKYTEEWRASYDLEEELKQLPVSEYDSYKCDEVRKALAVLNCIVKYNENYFKDEEGYL